MEHRRNRSSADSRAYARFVRWAGPLSPRLRRNDGIIWTVIVHVKTSESAVASAPLLGDDRRPWRSSDPDEQSRRIDDRRDSTNYHFALAATARYLCAEGAGTNLRGALFAYYHADWYVAEVGRARRKVRRHRRRGRWAGDKRWPSAS